MSLVLPKLEVLPVKDLLRHEWHDDQRSIPLAKSLKASGVLKNPPIVSPLKDGTERYMVLDGANRTTALGQIALSHTVCQVVQPGDPGLELKTWNHVLWGWGPEKLLAALRGIPETELLEIDPGVRRPQRSWPEKTLVWLQTPDRQAYILRSGPGELIQRAKKLAKVAEVYVQEAKLDRTTTQRVSELNGAYPDLTAVVVYPPFSVEEVLALTSAGALLPPGVTRFTISPRALRLNYPLDRLAEDKPLAEKNADLDEWIQQKTGKKEIRFYSEATVLFDE